MTDSSLTRDWAQFDPLAYLTQYYGDVGSENRALLQFLMEAYRDVQGGGILLDFGGGPTIYPLISAIHRIDEIHFSDFLDANLDQVRRWLARDPGAFDWSAFVCHALELETGRPCSDAAVAAREDEIRSKVTRLIRCDASNPAPIDRCWRPYDVIVTNFCAESATSDRWQWQMFVRNIVSLLRPGGSLILSALKGASSYSVGSKSFPAVDVSEEDLIEVLGESGCPEKTIEVRAVPADRPTRDYEGLLLAVATKEDPDASGGI